MTRGRHPIPPRPTTGAAGFTVVELLAVLWLMAILAAVSVPAILSGLDDHRTRAAARYLSGRFSHARLEALKRSQRVGYQFLPDGADWSFGAFADANGNGIRTAEIADGIDVPLWPAETLSRQFQGVRFGLVPGVRSIDGSTGADPIRIGSARILTFTPSGTSSSGTLYLRGRGPAQYAVRIFGVTGRTRVFRYEAGRAEWRPM